MTDLGNTRRDGPGPCPQPTSLTPSCTVKSRASFMGTPGAREFKLYPLTEHLPQQLVFSHPAGLEVPTPAMPLTLGSMDPGKKPVSAQAMSWAIWTVNSGSQVSRLVQKAGGLQSWGGHIPLTSQIPHIEKDLARMGASKEGPLFIFF